MSTPEKEHEKTVKACLIFHVNLQKGQIFHVPAFAALYLSLKGLERLKKCLTSLGHNYVSVSLNFY